MRLIKILAAAAVATTVAGSAIAGGFSETVIESTPITVIDPVIVPAGSLPGWVIPAVVAAALIAVATQGGSD